MILGFKRRFARYVREGSKTHTIRAGERWKVGDRCDCYVDPRQTTMTLLGRWRCAKVERIVIYERREGTFGVVIGRNELAPDEKDAFAWRDGFREEAEAPFVQMIRFWMKEHGDGRDVEVNRVNHRAGELFLPRPTKPCTPLAFKGQVIHWLYDVKTATSERDFQRWVRRVGLAA